MIYKTVRSLFLFIFLASLVFAQETKEKVLVLKWKFKKGETFNYKSNMDLKFKVKSPMQNMDGKMNMEFLYACKVIDVNETAGTATLQLKVKSLKANMDMGPLGKVTVDSNDPESMKKMEEGVSPMMGGMNFKEMLKKTITVVVDKTGKVQSIKGLQKNSRGQSGPDQGAIEEIFLELPMGPISQGASWSKNLIKAMMGTPAEVETKYSFKAMEKVGNENCAKISIQQKWKIDLKKNPMTKMLKVNITKSEGEGVALFGIESGKMVSKNSKMNIQISMSGNMGGQDLTMEQQIKGKISVKLVK